MVDLSAIQHNFGLVRKLAGKKAQIWPAVKADAYGHGARPVALTLEEAGADGFCVATPWEAFEIKEVTGGKPILLLGSYLDDDSSDIVESQAETVVATIAQAKALSKAATKAKTTVRVHLKIDTGMGRIGFPRIEALDAACEIDVMEGLELAAIMTHFASSDDEDLTFANHQLADFRAVGREITLRLRRSLPMHCANSAAILALPDSALQIVRPGIMIYGCYPSKSVRHIAQLQPVMTLKSRIVFLKDVAIGGSVSYGRTWTAKRPSRIATVSIGYGDGLPRLLSNAGNVLVRGQQVPIIGRICMDQTMVDVTDIPGSMLGDEVVFWGKQGKSAIAAEDVAEQIGTIAYELTCGVSQRVLRDYIA
ncbi:MAG: alanine racemase [Armatimonadota bacterium]